MSDKEKNAFVAQCEKLRAAKKEWIEARKVLDEATRSVQSAREKLDAASAKESIEKAALDKLLEA